MSLIQEHFEQKNFWGVETMRVLISKRPWLSLTPRQKLLRKRSLEVLSEARKSKGSFSKIAKKHDIAPKTVLYNTNSFRKRRGRWNAKRFDKIPRVMKINENGKEISIQINDSRTAALIGRYHNAVKKFLNTGDKKALRKFRRKKIKDIDGNLHSFETNPASIIEINERIEEPEFYELYAV